MACGFLQHVFLADIPERFPNGARWGDLLYDLAIAYIGAYAFYLLIVRLPLLRDRANVYQGIEVLLWRVFDESRGLIMELNRLARVGDPHPQTPEDMAIVKGELRATLDHVRSLCERISPDLRVDRGMSPVEWIRLHAERAHKATQDVQIFAQYLGSRAVILLARIDLSRVAEACTMFYEPAVLSRPPENLRQLAEPIAWYLSAAYELEEYRLANFGGRTRDELLADLRVDVEKL